VGGGFTLGTGIATDGDRRSLPYQVGCRDRAQEGTFWSQ
jgi:hypothetical protein